MRGLSLAAASAGHSSLRCAGLSLSWPLLLRSTGSRRAGSVVVAHGPSCSTACGICPEQGSNLCPLHRQADSQPLRHQGSPHYFFFSVYIFISMKVVQFPRILFSFTLASSLSTPPIPTPSSSQPVPAPLLHLTEDSISSVYLVETFSNVCSYSWTLVLTFSFPCTV